MWSFALCHIILYFTQADRTDREFGLYNSRIRPCLAVKPNHPRWSGLDVQRIDTELLMLMIHNMELIIDDRSL